MTWLQEEEVQEEKLQEEKLQEEKLQEDLAQDADDHLAVAPVKPKDWP